MTRSSKRVLIIFVVFLSIFVSSIFNGSSPVYARNPARIIDDIPRAKDKIFWLLKKWNPDALDTSFDEAGRLTRALGPEDIQRVLDVSELRVAESLFRSDLEKYLSKIYRSEELAGLPSQELVRFRKALNQLKEIRSSFTLRTGSFFVHADIEKAFKILNADFELGKLTARMPREEILEGAQRLTGKSLSSVLNVPKILRAGERWLSAAEYADLLSALKLKHGDLGGKIVNLERKVDRVRMTRPYFKMAKDRLAKLEQKLRDLHKAQERVLMEMYYLRENPRFVRVSFGRAFKGALKRLKGVEPDIEEKLIITDVRFGKILGDTVVGTCNVLYKIRHPGLKLAVVEGLLIIKTGVITVVAFAVLVPPAKSVVGDYLTMEAFKILDWQYRKFLEGYGEGKHDLSVECPVCHPNPDKDFLPEWKKHGMSELTQVENPMVQGDLNNFFFALFYGNMSAMPDPIRVGRDLYIALLMSALHYKMSYVTNETLQHVIWLRLGKTAETYEEKRMLLEDLNVSILSNYWIVEYAFFWPLIEPNVVSVAHEHLYHLLFPHYLHRQPDIIKKRYKEISEFLNDMKKEEDAVIEKAREFGFRVDEVGLEDAAGVARTEKRETYFTDPVSDPLKYGLLGKYLYEQEDSLRHASFRNLEMVPRIDEIKDDVEGAFTQKRIYLPEIQGKAFIWGGQEGEELKKREEIENMIEKVKEKQKKYIDNLLLNGIMGLSSTQRDIAAQMNREFPKTSEEIDRLLGQAPEEFETELLELMSEFDEEKEQLSESDEAGASEDRANDLSKLKEKYTEKYKELYQRAAKRTSHITQEEAERIAKLLESGNELSEEYKAFRKEYDKFVIENMKALAQLQGQLSTHDEKITKLIESLGGELKQAQLELSEIKRRLGDIESHIIADIRSALDAQNTQTVSKLEEILTLLKEIKEAINSK